MFDKDKVYTLEELLSLYNMYNLEFKYYGNNQNGKLEFYMKTDANKVSIFTSLNSEMTKKDYLALSEEEAKKVKFIFDREVSDLDLDIVAVVLKTSDVNIPCGRYSLETLDKLTKEQDLEERKSGVNDGICYFIVDNNTACNLYDGIYNFGKNNKGLIEGLKEKYKEEDSELLKNNLKIVLDYLDELEEKDEIVR